MSEIAKFFMTSPVPPEGIAQSLWLIIALPLLGAFICGVFGRMMGRANVYLVACAAVGGSLLLSALAFWAVNDLATVYNTGGSVEAIRYALGHDFGTWFSAGTFRVNLGLYVDRLTGTMLIVITGVGLLIHIYSTSYMSHDEGYWRYFAYLNLFVAMMLTLVLADSLPLMFVGWEGVGLCSYLLIGFWYTDPAKAWAGRKAFVTNRIGDFSFIIGMMLLVLLVSAYGRQMGPGNMAPNRATAWRTAVSEAGPLNFQALEVMARGVPASEAAGPAMQLATPISEGPLSGFTFGGVLTGVLVLFMLGAAGKSAQLPLYVWLPDAMAGPTPVSALIHAATMVTAGVYLFCRLSYLLVLSPVAMATVAIIGALTALFAALIAFAQDDIKKVLAYSTVSQLGFMFLGVGMGVFWAAAFHLVTHAFFKACLFLGAGSVMHGNAEETDIKKLGGLRKEMPITAWTFLISTIAITGVLPLSGFFSKDAILHGVHSTHLKGLEWVTPLVWTIALIAAFCTAFYMARLYWLTFEGNRSKDAKTPHAHESDAPMTLPLVILAVFAVVLAFWGLPTVEVFSGKQALMENWLSPVFLSARRLVSTHDLIELHHTEGLPWSAWLTAWAIALAGAGLSVYAYRQFFPSRAGQPVPAYARLVRGWAQAKFYVDELYELVIIRPLKFASNVLYRVVDTLIIDTIGVRGTAWVTRQAGSALRYLQTGDSQSYAAVMAVAVLGAVVYAFFALQ